MTESDSRFSVKVRFAIFLGLGVWAKPFPQCFCWGLIGANDLGKLAA